jgi:hypothetical protein
MSEVVVGVVVVVVVWREEEARVAATGELDHGVAWEITSATHKVLRLQLVSSMSSKFLIRTRDQLHRRNSSVPTV